MVELITLEHQGLRLDQRHGLVHSFFASQSRCEGILVLKVELDLSEEFVLRGTSQLETVSIRHLLAIDHVSADSLCDAFPN